MIRSFYIFILPVFLLMPLSCSPQNDSRKEEDQAVLLYKKYNENRYEYEKRGAILAQFKTQLLSTFSNPSYRDSDFPVLDKNFHVATSEDRKLTIISWDWFNNGTWQIFESMYRYMEGDKIYTGYLYLEDDTEGTFKDGYYYQINKLPDNGYLIKGYGTHGGGNDFYVLRKLLLYEGKLTDCESCFAGNETLALEKWKAEDVSIEYDEDTKTIAYPDQITVIKDGEDTGFVKTTDSILKLHYKNGKFNKIEDK